MHVYIVEKENEVDGLYVFEREEDAEAFRDAAIRAGSVGTAVSLSAEPVIEPHGSRALIAAEVESGA